LASASHRPRPRIGSWVRVTCTSTRGGSYHPPGIVPSQPPGSGSPAPCEVLRDRPIPLRRVPGPHRPSQRRSALGRSVVERVDGAISTDLPLGGGTSRQSHWGLVLADLHPHPGMATRSAVRSRPDTGPGSSDRDTWSRFGGTSRHPPFVRHRGRVRLRPAPGPMTGRQVAVQRTGLGRPTGLRPIRPPALERPGLGRRPPWPPTAVAWAHHAPAWRPPLRPRSHRTAMPAW